jgi:hypothetical protein
MDDRETLCVKFSPETTRWLSETADACNTTPEDVVRLLVIAPVFMDDEAPSGHDGAPVEDAAPSGQTQTLIREALGKIYEVSARQRVDSATIRDEVRSMFEIMREQ